MRKQVRESLIGTDGTDWNQLSLTPHYLQRFYTSGRRPDLPSVEEDPELEAERNKSMDEAVHETLEQRFERMTE
jgi:hypothetical protein